MTENNSQHVHRVRQSIHPFITVEPGVRLSFDYEPKRELKLMVAWAKELQAFLRGHTEYPRAIVTVNHDLHDMCSGCGGPWEVMVDGDDRTTILCASCGQPVSETAEARAD